MGVRETLAANIVRRREELRLTQSELATRAETSVTTVLSIEKAKSGTNIDLLGRIAVTLKTTPAALLSELSDGHGHALEECLATVAAAARGSPVLTATAGDSTPATGSETKDAILARVLAMTEDEATLLAAEMAQAQEIERATEARRAQRARERAKKV